MGFEMAAPRRHWKEKDGRFWARIAIPATLRSYFGGKTQLTEALGGDRRQADRIHPAAVARLQEQIENARRMQQRLPTTTALDLVKRPISANDIKSAIWEHHLSLLAGDELKRAQMPTFEDMTAEYERIWSKIDSGEIGIGVDAIGVINSQTEYELMLGAAGFYQRLNSKRLAHLDPLQMLAVFQVLQRQLAQQRLDRLRIFLFEYPRIFALVIGRIVIAIFHHFVDEEQRQNLDLACEQHLFPL